MATYLKTAVLPIIALLSVIITCKEKVNESSIDQTRFLQFSDTVFLIKLKDELDSSAITYVKKIVQSNLLSDYHSMKLNQELQSFNDSISIRQSFFDFISDTALFADKTGVDEAILYEIERSGEVFTASYNLFLKSNESLTRYAFQMEYGNWKLVEVSTSSTLPNEHFDNLKLESNCSKGAIQGKLVCSRISMNSVASKVLIDPCKEQIEI